MPKEKSFKRILVCSIYLILSLVCILGIYFLISMSSNKENDNIVRAQDSSSYLRSINPKFLVDFVNNEYIRFETVSSYSNPFEETESNIWDRIKYILGIKQEKKGIQISLLDVSYDTNLMGMLGTEDIDVSKYTLNKSFELTSIGRVIGQDDSTGSKDTVISKDIYKGVDIEYQIIKGKGLKEEIVLNDIPEYQAECGEGECTYPVNRFLFQIVLDEGLTIKKSFSGNSTYPVGTYYIVDGEGNYFAHFLPEFAIDSVGNKTSNVVSNILQTDSDVYIYEIILDPEWLLSNDRVFPIRIDPSIIHDSELVFEQGEYDRTVLDSSLMITLNSNEYSSGTYTSSVVDIGENTLLNSISWDGYAQATGDGEIPFSPLGLIYENDFNGLTSEKKKWGSGALALPSLDDSYTFNIDSLDSNFSTLELWAYVRNIPGNEYIFKSNLGNIKLQDNIYIFEDVDGVEYVTQIPVRYNTWQYISLVFNISGSQVTIYIDESEYTTGTTYGIYSKLDDITFGGVVGYVDSVRVYDRVLARNELLSNSQYINIFLQYAKSSDGLQWSNWGTQLEYIPTPLVDTDSIEITSEDDLNIYDIFSFEFLSDTQKSITLGSSKFVNGLVDESMTLLSEKEGVLDGQEGIKYLDIWFNPIEKQNSCILSLEGLEIYTQDTGKVVVSVVAESISLDDMYIQNIDNHIGISISDLNMSVYLNGNGGSKDIVYTLIPTTYTVGNGCTNSSGTFNGEISNLRISTTERTHADILQYSDIKSREYILKPIFKAQLQNDTQILDINDIEFDISEIPFGSSNLISNLFTGDTIVISQDEYMVEGEVISLDKDIGTVRVGKWKEGGTVPLGGFTTLASVLKWQREYIPTNIFFDLSISNTGIDMKYDDIQNIRDIQMFSAISSNEMGELIGENIRYVKYRFIYTSSKQGISSYLASIMLDFVSGGPSMDQVMRHGKWFNEGSEQTFWWSK